VSSNSQSRGRVVVFGRGVVCHWCAYAGGRWLGRPIVLDGVSKHGIKVVLITGHSHRP